MEHTIALLNNDADDTCIIVRALPVLENEMMSNIFEMANLTYDIEKKDFLSISEEAYKCILKDKLKVSISKQTELINEYYRGILKECELKSELSKLQTERYKNWNIPTKDKEEKELEKLPYVEQLKIWDIKIPHSLNTGAFINSFSNQVSSNWKPISSNIKPPTKDANFDPNTITNFNKNSSLVPDTELKLKVTDLNSKKMYDGYDKNVNNFDSSKYSKYCPYNNEPELLAHNFKNEKKSSPTPSGAVLIHVDTLSTIYTEDEKKIALVNNYPEYGFITLLRIINTTEILNMVRNTFHKITHESTSKIQDKLNFLDKYVLAMETSTNENNTNLQSEKEIVEKVMKQVYILSDNVENKMRAQDIFQYFKDTESYYPFAIDTLFRNRLSKYLIDLGLTKKRYTDGYYYYGIVKREKLVEKSTNYNNNIEAFTKPFIDLSMSHPNLKFNILNNENTSQLFTSLPDKLINEFEIICETKNEELIKTFIKNNTLNISSIIQIFERGCKSQNKNPFSQIPHKKVMSFDIRCEPNNNNNTYASLDSAKYIYKFYWNDCNRYLNDTQGFYLVQYLLQNKCTDAIKWLLTLNISPGESIVKRYVKDHGINTKYMQNDYIKDNFPEVYENECRNPGNYKYE